MKKDLGKRVQKLEEHLAEHVQDFRENKADGRTLVARIIKDVRRFFSSIFSKAPEGSRKKAIHYVKLGMKEFNKKDFREAIHYFEKSLKADPDYARAHAYLGDAWHKRNQLTKAVTAWQKAIETDPKSDAARHAKDKLRHTSVQ